MNNLTSKEEMMRRIEELEQALEEEKRKKAVTRYGLIWEDSPEKLDDPNIVPLLSIDTDEYLTRFIKGNELNKDILMDEEKPMNYLIEGDNYHSLKALERTHTGKIDVIYIDPPYNTGKEFVYNDKIVDKEDGYRHSKWLSFMSKRLELARRLMSDDGVIFVSIDDNEQAQLKLLMDSIFGENNFITTFIWEKGGGNSLSKTTRSVTEYIHVYSKKKENIELIHEVTKQQGDGSLYKAKNKVNTLTFKAGEVLFINNEEGVVKFEDFPKGYLSNSFTIKGGKNTNKFSITDKWTWTQDYLESQLEDGTQIISKNKNLRLRYMKNSEVRVRPRTLLPKDVGYTITGSSELRAMGVDGFDYPKPVGIVKYLVNLVTKETKCATILDFFAGSGTTGHAVLELNKEDGGNRQFILCTNNEVSEEKVRNHFHEQGLIPKPNKTEFRKFEKENPDQVLDFMKSAEYQELGIARSVTYERLRRVIEGYTTPKGKDVAGIPANLMYLTTAEYTKEDVRRAREEGRFVDTTDMYAGIYYLKYPRTTHTVMFVTDDLSFNNFKVIDTLPTDNVVIVLSGLDYPHETANIIRKEVKTKNLIFEHLRY